MAEAQPYLDYRQREMLFREGVISFMGISDGQSAQQQDEEAYQAALKMQERIAASGK